MEGNIKTIADLTMNLYFQDYANGAEFFDIDDFVNYTGIAYADLLSQEYDTERKIMYQLGEDDFITFSHDWLKTEVLKRENDDEGNFIKLSQPVMSFPFSKVDIGIQNIFPVGGKFKYELVRSNINQMWMNSFLPLTKTIYWALLENKIYFSSTVVDPASSYRVIYVPAPNPELEVPASRQKMVIQNTIMLMRQSANGYVVKETNDGNLNPIIPTEADQNLIKP